MPTTIHEYFNLMNAQHEKFDALPVTIKQKFENSFEVWATAAGTSEWLEKMGIQQNAQTQNQDHDQTIVQNDNKEAK